MGLFDKSISKEERKSLELAEESRQDGRYGATK